MKRNILFLTVCLALLGCATPPRQSASDLAIEDAKAICTKIKVSEKKFTNCVTEQVPAFLAMRMKQEEDLRRWEREDLAASWRMFSNSLQRNQPTYTDCHTTSTVIGARTSCTSY